MKLYNNQPNFTIILPVGCNAKCSFCFWHKSKTNKSYLENLKRSIERLPKKYFNQVTISGGEPTMYDTDSFIELLDYLRKRFDKIVLNTNGYKLKEFLQNDFIRNNIDYINLSRHHVNDSENEKVFRSSSVPTTLDIIGFNNLKKIRLNCVYDDNIENYKEWLDYAENTGCEGVAFRRLAENAVKKKSTLEKILDRDNDMIIIEKSKCKVCYTASYIHKEYDLKISIRYSVDEPQDYMKRNTVFEAISNGDGDLFSRWDNNPKYKTNNLNYTYRANILDTLLTALYYKLYKEVI